MKSDINEPPSLSPKADWTGLKIVVLTLPVFIVFAWLRKAEMGFTASIILSLTILIIRLRWELRKYWWFWVAISLALALNIPLLLLIKWREIRVPTIAVSVPLGIMDFLAINGLVSFAKRPFLKVPLEGEDC